VASTIQERRPAPGGPEGPAEVHSLFVAARALLECRDFAESAHRIFNECRKATGATSGYVALRNEAKDENELVFLEAGGLPCSVDPTLPMPIQGLRAEAYARAETVCENDFPVSPWQALLPGGHVTLRNVLFAPLVLDGTAVGVMGLANKPTDFTQQGLRVASAMADLAAVALRRARTDAALLRREQERRSIFEHMASGCCLDEILYDDDGRPVDYRILDVNPAFTRIAEAPREDLVGRLASEIYGVSPPPNLEIYAQVAETGDPVCFETYFPHVDKHVQITASCPGPGRFSNLVTDLTEQRHKAAERRKLEEQLVLSQRLEAIGRLAGGVAHDFNNLLTVIDSYAGFAVDALPAGDPVRDDVEQIQQAAQRAAALTRQLLAFSRRQLLAPSVLDLGEVVQDLRSMLARLLGEDIDIAIHLAPDLGAVRADRSQMEQVLLNLAINARDAMPQGGKLTIELRNALLDETYPSTHRSARPGPHVLLAVSDTGRGMDAETVSHIFEPFFTTRGQAGGTGLGLATVYGIVKQSGGNIWVYSEPALGTTFKVYLPSVALEERPESAPGVRTRPRGAETILLVEDQRAVRALTERILSGVGYHVVAAASGEDALRLCEAGAQPQLLLTDVVMPQMSGRQLAERLQPRYPGLRVLYMSGYTDDAVVRHGVLEHATCFISKPFSAAELTTKVRQVLDGYGAQDAPPA